jgi:hypothetical protein
MTDRVYTAATLTREILVLIRPDPGESRNACRPATTVRELYLDICGGGW